MELYGSLVANEGSGGGGGTADVPIKSISVNGSGVVPVNKNVNIDVPTKTSELENDSSFASTSDIPTKVSELDNDSKFVTDDELTAKGYASTSDIPTKTSQLENDSNFASTSDIPTKVSQLTNDSKFVTESDLTAKDYADKTYVGEQIAQSEHLKRKFVTVLPEPSVADEHTIYMLKVESVQGDDKYKEYMLIEGVVQCVGDTSVDLTDYAKTADVDASISTLQTNKADLSVLKEHTDNVDIHVTTEEKTTWGTVTNKVDKEEGKGLSSNDYTSEEKTKLSNIGTSQGRNIIPYPYSQTTKTVYGVTFTDNKDGSISISGTQDSSTTRPYMGIGIWWNTNDRKTGNISISANTYFTISANCNSNNAGLRYFVYDESGSKLADSTVYGSSTKTLKFDVDTWIALCVETAANSEIYDCTCKPQLELGSIAHAYEPPVESNVNLKAKVDKIPLSRGSNLIPYPYYNGTSFESNGITYTVNEYDGTITINGTATKESDFRLISPYDNKDIKTLELGQTYTLSDGVNQPNSGGYQAPVYLQFVRLDTTRNDFNYAISTNYGNMTWVANEDNLLKYGIRVVVRAGVTADNVVMKPMLEVGAIAHSYEPTTESNVSLKSEVDKKADKSEVCVNLLNPTLQTTTLNGVTCTNNGDGTYTFNGTATGAIWLTTAKINVKVGEKYKLVGCPYNGSSTTYRLYATGIENDYGNGLIFTPITTNQIIGIGILSGTVLNNVTFKPMLTTNLSATYDDFVPYTGDRDSLNEDVADIKKDLGDLTFSASGTTLTITDGTNTWTLEANN